MTKTAEIQSDYKKAGAMHSMLAPCAFVGSNAVLTKRGDIFSVLRVGGIDPECLDAGQLEYIVRGFEAALRILGPEYRVYQYLLKQDSPTLPISEHEHPIAERRAEWLHARAADLYSVSLFLVVLRERTIQDTNTARTVARNLISRFSVSETLEVSRKELSREAELLTNAVNSLVVQLRDSIRPHLLNREQTTGFLRRLVNCTPWKASVSAAVQDFHLDQQIAHSGIECWPTYLKQDEYFIRLLSLTEPPAQTFPHLLRGLLSVACNFVICSEWKRENNHKIRAEIDKKRRHYHFAKTSMLSYLGDSQPRPDEILIDDSKTAVVDELNKCLREMEVNENFFGRFSLTIGLYHTDESSVQRAVAKMAEVFSTHDAKLTDERYNMLNAWRAMVPGNYTYNFRHLLLLNTNYADLSFLFAPATGEKWNGHLNRPCLAVVETREASPYFLNLHYQDVAHTLILGAIGSGKSFLDNFLVSSYQQYQPVTVIFDLGGSYQKLTREYAGSYLHVGQGSRAFTINPFSLEPTKTNLDFLFSFVRVLVEGRNYQMSVEELKDLHRGIGDLYALDAGTRRLSTLAQTVNRSYGKLLEAWVGAGRLAEYFDNAEDNLSVARFQTFDFEGMDQPDVLEPLLFYILHRANASIYDRAQAAVPKLFVFDEAWRFFRNPTTRAYIVEALKTWRKRNAALILATQSSDDMMREEMLAVVSESCFTKIFLANPGMDAASYRETFHLNETEAAQIARLVPKQQFLLKTPELAKVLNLKVDPESLRIFGNR